MLLWCKHPNLLECRHFANWKWTFLFDSGLWEIYQYLCDVCRSCEVLKRSRCSKRQFFLPTRIFYFPNSVANWSPCRRESWLTPEWASWTTLLEAQMRGSFWVCWNQSYSKNVKALGSFCFSHLSSVWAASYRATNAPENYHDYKLLPPHPRGRVETTSQKSKIAFFFRYYQYISPEAHMGCRAHPRTHIVTSE